MATSQGRLNNSRERKTRSDGAPGDDLDPFVISLSVRFLIIAMFSVVVVAFSAGKFSMYFLLRRHGVITAPTEAITRALPLPVYPELKSVPHTVYSSKHYDTGAVAKSDSLLARRAKRDDALVWQNVKQTIPLTQVESSQQTTNNVNATVDQHEPSGQHLLVDIKGVDGVFLNSEEMLANAMVSLVELSGLTLLSYHCHKLPPIGVSCVGVLLESHISFHTWPIPGAISLDLFTCGEGSLLPILPEIERKFGVPRKPAVQGGLVEKPFMQWAHKKRGFRSAEGNPEDDTDFNQFLLGWMEFDMKQLVVSVETDYQMLKIYDVINPRFRSLEAYKNSLANDGSYEAKMPHLFRPDRLLYLDGVMQSRFYGEAAYHEALVHPAMITHTNPKRVAIIGGGKGATLREVLKHKTVETITMIEMDEVMVKICKEYIPEWSNCSTLVGSAPSCFDDPRAEIFYADAIAWLIDRFADVDKVDPGQVYDVIIMDAMYATYSVHCLCRSCVYWLNSSYLLSPVILLLSSSFPMFHMTATCSSDRSGTHSERMAFSSPKLGKAN
jgi:S-adenosylmethionine decarboxylase proenzyme